jgi:hypothetical protein
VITPGSDLVPTISHTDSLAFCLISIISFMSTSVLVVLGALFASKLMYQSSARSLSVIANCVSLVSSSVIYFDSHIFSQINRCFSGSYVASPRNYGNLMVGLCPAILNVELLPPRGVDT